MVFLCLSLIIIYSSSSIFLIAFMKKYLKTAALAILFAVVFSLVYNAIVDFINKQRGKESRESRGEISVADIPSYSFKFQLIDKTQEQDEPDEKDYIRS